MKKSPTVPRTYQLTKENIDQVNAIAAELEAHPSRVVDMLLTRSLSEISAGRWQLGRQPLIYAPHWADNGTKPPPE